jgi:glycogen operon protein
MPEYRTWRRVLNTADAVQSAVDLSSGAEAKAPPRSVLAFAGAA